MNKLLWCTFVFATAMYITGAVIDPDLWWHIVVGRWILAHGTVPSQDYWTLFGSGTPWKAYSWLVEVVFARVDSLGGIHGLLVLQALFATLLAGTFFTVFGKLSRDWMFGALLGAYATVATFNHFTLRPQVLVWVYFAVLLFLTDTIVERPEKRKVAIFSLCALMMLWGNTHISAIIGLGGIAAWSISRIDLSLVLKLVLVGFIGSCLTPYLGGEWRMFFETATHPFSFQAISEFASANIFQYSTVFLVLLVLLVATFFHLGARYFLVFPLLLGGGLALAGLAIVKMLPFAIVALAAALAKAWGGASEGRTRFGNLGEGASRLTTALSRVPKEGLTFFLASTAIVNGYSVWQNPVDLSITPIAAVNFMEANKLPFPLLNTFGSGGYLMYRLANAEGDTREKVAIDGRTNLIPAPLWQKFIATLNGRIGWRAFIDAVKPRTILWKWESPLTTILLEGESWCFIFGSGSPTSGTVLFVSREEFDLRKGSLKSKNCQ